MPLTSGHSNQAASTIRGGAAGNGQPLKVGDRLMTVQSGDGSKFPAVAPYLIVFGAPTSGSHEECLVTARIGDQIDLVRGYNGTPQQQWAVGSPVQLAPADSGDVFGMGQLANGLLTLMGNASQALVASGTITTSGLAVSRVTPGATCTGVILQAGMQDGQVCIVENDHASNTVTMAAAGTSHVANGVGEVIAALTATMYVWNASAALWYKVA